MGRELRTVPAGWSHPRKDNGDYQPMFDCWYDTAAAQWLEGLRAWEAGERPEYAPESCKYFWDWEGGPPDEEYFRADEWTDEERTHFQLYETVSEGTPLSPPMPSLDALAEWLSANTDFWGYGPVPIEQARRFCQVGWAPSMIVQGGVLSGPGIAVVDALPPAI